MSTKVGYLAHPLGPDGPQREENIRRAKRWLRYLIATYPDWSFEAGWVIYAEVLSEAPENRARGIRDNIERQRACHGIFLCGGRITPGMLGELVRARASGHEEFDLLHLGEEPPA